MIFSSRSARDRLHIIQNTQQKKKMKSCQKKKVKSQRMKNGESRVKGSAKSFTRQMEFFYTRGLGAQLAHDVPFSAICRRTLKHVLISHAVSSCGVNCALIEQLAKLHRRSHLWKRFPAYDGRKSFYTAGPLTLGTAVGEKASSSCYMVVYQYGSAVLFNMEEHEVESYLGIIKKHASGLLHEMRKDGARLILGIG